MPDISFGWRGRRRRAAAQTQEYLKDEGDTPSEYLSSDTSEMVRGDYATNRYTAEDLSRARSDWSDFESPREEPLDPASAVPSGEGIAGETAAAAQTPLVEEPERGTGAARARGFAAAPPRGTSAGGEADEGSAGAWERAPETAAIPVPHHQLKNWHRDWHQDIRDLEHRLLGAERTLTYREMAQRMGVSTRSARKLWRALGFPNLENEVKAFTETDAEALATMVDLVRDGYLNEETAISLTRSVGQMTDRMVVWQIEALVEDKITNEQLSDAVARTQVIESLPQLIDPIERLMSYAWRRQLSAALQRLTVRVESGLAATAAGRDGSEDDAPLPLARAVGFADLVSYTSLSRQMNERTLAQMVQRFESRCAEIISIGGGRLVKTVGDEVLFNAETPEAGAQIALALSEAIAADDVLPESRVSVIWGRVLSRMGDIYGPTVNLAARLTGLADPGTILVDSVTAQALEAAEDYLLVPQPPRVVRGFGEVQPHLLLRAGGSRVVMETTD